MRRKLLTLIVALIVILGVSFLVSPGAEVEALPANSTLITYYSDSTYQDEVGYRYISCFNGGSSTGGQTTAFYLIDREPC